MPKKIEGKNLHNIKVPKPKFPEPGSKTSPNTPMLEDFYIFNMKEIEFLQEFSKTLDVDHAGKHVGWKKSMINVKVNEEKMQKEMNEIFSAWRETIRFTGEQSSSRFLKIMNKIENKFDDGHTEVASALSKMASDYMKATGHFNNTTQTTAPQVQINIELPSEPKVVNSDNNIEIGIN